MYSQRGAEEKRGGEEEEKRPWRRRNEILMESDGKSPLGFRRIWKFDSGGNKVSPCMQKHFCVLNAYITARSRWPPAAGDQLDLQSKSNSKATQPHQDSTQANKTKSISAATLNRTARTCHKQHRQCVSVLPVERQCGWATFPGPLGANLSVRLTQSGTQKPLRCSGFLPCGPLTTMPPSVTVC